MTVTVLINIVLRDGLAPGRAALELDVLGVNTGVDDVDINARTAVRVVLVLGESTERELRAVADARKALEEESADVRQQDGMMS